MGFGAPTVYISDSAKRAIESQRKNSVTLGAKTARNEEGNKKEEKKKGLLVEGREIDEREAVGIGKTIVESCFVSEAKRSSIEETRSDVFDLGCHSFSHSFDQFGLNSRTVEK